MRPRGPSNTMKFILGEKKEMTQVFDDKGQVSAATVLSAGPMVITQVKNLEKDGYAAVQVGFGVRKEKRLSKAVRGHLKDLGKFRYLREFRGADLLASAEDLQKGAKIDVSIFAPGDKVSVTAISKSKGFQGVVKRHGFKGGSRTHGQKHSEREPGTIGGGIRAKVPKGKRMAGRMGGETITVKNLEVLRVDPEINGIYIKGAVPGRRGTLVEIRGMKS